MTSTSSTGGAVPNALLPKAESSKRGILSDITKESAEKKNKSAKECLQEGKSENDSTRCSIYQKGEPLVYVDIHINKEKIERVAIYEGDKLDEVISRFCLKNGLSLKEMDALRDSLRRHLPYELA